MKVGSRKLEVGNSKREAAVAANAKRIKSYSLINNYRNDSTSKRKALD
ncbi:hypothetical protein [uncultured Draconibacterium sp.]